MTIDVIFVGPEETLDTALELITQHDTASLPVTNSGADLTLLGVINRAYVTCAYASAVKGILRDPPRNRHAMRRKQRNKQRIENEIT